MTTTLLKMEGSPDVKNQKDRLNKEFGSVKVEEDTNREREERETTDQQKDGSSCLVSWKGIRRQLKSDHRYRELIIYSLCLYIGKFIQGWCQSLFGPSYIDIRMISGTDLAKGSWILTAKFIGSALGSIIQGALYGRLSNKLTFGSALCWNGIILAVIPWCAIFETMICAHVLLGIAFGIYASGISAEVLVLWGKDSRVAFIACQLIITIGSALAPLTAAPFLIEQETMNFQNVSSVTTIPIVENLTHSYALQNIQSVIYIPFSMTCGMSLLSGLFFFVLYFKYDGTHKSKKRIDSKASHKSRKVPKLLYLFIISMLGLVSFIFAGANEAFPGFLASYCVKYFHWSKKKGAFITFIFFIFNLASQIVAIIIQKWMDTIIYTVVNFVFVFLSILGLLIISLNNWYNLAWLFVPMFGFSKGCLFAMIFSWTNDYIVNVTGRISAFYYICLMIGGIFNPILFGYVMENIGLVWFCYILLIESISMLILIAIILVATRYVVRHFGRPLYQSQTIEEEAINKDRRKDDDM